MCSLTEAPLRPFLLSWLPWSLLAWGWVKAVLAWGWVEAVLAWWWAEEVLLCGEVVLCVWLEEDGVEIEGEGDVGVVVVGVTGDLCSAAITVYIGNQRE